MLVHFINYMLVTLLHVYFSFIVLGIFVAATAEFHYGSFEIATPL